MSSHFVAGGLFGAGQLVARSCRVAVGTGRRTQIRAGALGGDRGIAWSDATPRCGTDAGVLGLLVSRSVLVVAGHGCVSCDGAFLVDGGLAVWLLSVLLRLAIGLLGHWLLHWLLLISCTGLLWNHSGRGHGCLLLLGPTAEYHECDDCA